MKLPAKYRVRDAARPGGLEHAGAAAPWAERGNPEDKLLRAELMLREAWPVFPE